MTDPKLRATIPRPLEAVRPLQPPWLRALWAVPIIAAITAGATRSIGFRPAAGQQAATLVLLPFALQLALGLALLALALRDAIPGRRVSRAVIASVAAAALAFHITVTMLVWLAAPLGYGSFLSSGWPCLSGELLLGIPLLASIAYLAARALPLSPSGLGMIVGFGSGMMVDASWRLVCPVTAPSHVLTAHFGGVLLLAAAGYAAGKLIERNT